MIKDSRSYETQIIDAVRSVNRALGGTYGTSSAIYKSEFNQYEVQLIDAIKGIGRTLSGKGLSLAGGGSADLAGYVTQKDFQSLSARVTKLENESFFRLVDGNVTLKEGYNNLWVPGFLAAGGIGTGGGGSSTLSGLDDVLIDTTSLADGDVLTWDADGGPDQTGIWVNAPGGGGSISVTNYGSSSTGKIATVGSTDIYNGVAWVGSEDTDHTIRLNVNGTTRWVCLYGYEGGGGGYIGTTAVQSTSQAQAMTGISSIKATSASTSLFAWDSTNSAWHFYGNIYADGWVAAGGVGSGGGGGGSLATLSDVSLSSPSNGQALVYRNGTWVNETIQGGGSTVSWGTPSTYYTPLTVNGTTKNVLIGTNYVNQDGTQEITGSKTFLSNPLKIGKTNSSNGIEVHQNSYIDIGNARLVYDSGANALHVTYKPGTGNTIGFFADGFVAAGGTAAQTTPAFVTLNTDQSIYGEKTFEEDLVVGTLGTFTVGGASTFNNAVTINALLEVNGVTLTGSSTKLSISKDVQIKYASSPDKYATISNIISRIEELESVTGIA